MPVYSVPTTQPQGEDPIIEAAKNFMQSPDYARKFMGNLSEAAAPMNMPANQPGHLGGGGGHGGHAGGIRADGTMSPAAEAAWAALSQKFPDLNVTSAYRDPSHNARVGGAKGSQHIEGNAYDFSTAGMDQATLGEILSAAQEVGFKGFGIYDNSLHLDVGPPRAWGPDYTRNSLPKWATQYIRY